MAKINTCLKWIFTIFNVFFAIVGGVIFGMGLLSQFVTSSNGNEIEGRTTGLIVLYIVGAVTMVIAIVGAYGAHRESRGALIVFLVCMVIGSMAMLRVGVPTAFVRPRLQGVLEDKFRQVLPLDTASSEVKNIADGLQTQLQCCGLFDSNDWEGNFPVSCLCDQQEEQPGTCQSGDTKYKYIELLQESTSVWAKPCLPFIMPYILLIADVMIAVIFTLAALALLGLGLSSLMIHQLRYGAKPVFVSVPAIYTGAPPKYQELINPPPY